ncbi:hypothetical protein HYDPIDRAFT_45842, partial [Hydnomerulius pinastri MD-312]
NTSSASWSPAEVIVLIDKVIAQKSKAGNGQNFRPAVWSLITSCKGLANPAKGGPKTGKACKEKWKRLRTTFYAVDHLTHASGFAYSEALGANIGVENESVWQE